jgi:mannose-6-phosphate isomerase-like protein (cupin superfamily)
LEQSWIGKAWCEVNPGATSEVVHQVEKHNWNGEGYLPLVFFGDWQVAALNWEPIFDPANLGEIERHTETDEVFVLWRGRGALLIGTASGIKVLDMEPGAIYNVTRGTWHALVATRDASWIIVETRNTHLHDTEIRQMAESEVEELHARLSDWLDHMGTVP